MKKGFQRIPFFLRVYPISHIMRRMKNKKLKAILSITGYFLLVIALCVSASIVFHNLYYELVYVSGTSMAPALNGNDNEKDGTVVDFGIADYHKSAINNIKRFSIVSTYYYDDYASEGVLKPNPKIKIKRVVAMPGETFKIEDSKLYIKNKETAEFEYVPYTFTIEPKVENGYTGKDIAEKQLGDNEFWVLGDHRDKSRDCGTLNQAIKKDYILGVLVAIEGQAQLKIKKYICNSCGKSTKSGSVCPNCYGELSPEYELVNKQYQWPKYF